MDAPGVAPVVYGYDAASRLTTITQAPLSPVTFEYDNAGRRTRLTLPNQVSTEYQYDIASRLTALIYRHATNPLGDLTYGYDAAGNRTRVGGSFARTLLPDAVATATYGHGNRQLQFGDQTMTFDANGNTTSLAAPTGTTTLTWDARNRLRGLEGGGPTATFTYTAGRRDSKTVNGSLTRYLYDRGDITQQLDPAGPTVSLRSLAIDELLALTGPQETSTLLADALGSTLAMIDGGGGTATQYTYAPFGATESTAPTFANPFQFTGRENDGIGGLYYYRARYYSAGLHRFMSEDPRGLLSGDANVYGYVGNNPLRFVDPLGLSKTASTTSPTPLVFFGIQASAFLGELFARGDRSIGAGKEVTLGLVIDFNTGSVKAFKSVGVARPDDPESSVAGANIGIGPVAGLFGGPLNDFFGEATEETLTGLPPTLGFTRIETPSGNVGASGGTSFGGSFTRIRTLTSPLFGE
jgi:RHS repeat-associated protein